MSLDAMKQALEALEECIGYKTSPFMERECEAAITALRAAIEQAQTAPAKGGLAEKVPAKGTVLEQTLKDVWDEMPHTALMDAIIGGTGVMLGDKRIDPASIYKQPDQKPVAWFTVDEINEWAARYLEKHPDQETRQWQGLTDEEIWSDGSTMDLSEDGIRKFARAIEAKLKEKNNG